jgi:hypothetical protein
MEKKVMRTRVLLSLAALVAVALAATPLLAHHAFSAEFDANKQVKLNGTVAKMDWINPHAWLHIEVKASDGKVTKWAIELGPPNALIKRGWNSSSIPVGLKVMVEGYQSKDGANRANGREVTLPDGKKLFAGSPGTGAPYEEPK